ncbi:hypothetical protein HYDPIDRAFT_134375 [Hydnomerulius pinastri MD-312]|uniref:Uncharacterized protein n=1 Tax=Hydnomerulius pinastri MD-312 TaxID=994086 RepID=A0A0C9VY88_9AGAM|nr:hypothetical protein HYDPIDRAFT_134375 [Hydnomerulius pinastri MD-312]
MAGKKRAAPADTATEKRETRSAKVPKTEGAKSAGKASAKGAARLKTSVPASVFKSRALPLHVNITHTPPSVVEGQEPVAQTDPGFLGSTTLVPTSFATGSFGWKGNKRMTVELPKVDGEEGEKVHVMLTINATVIGSKDVKDDDEEPHGEAEAEAEAQGVPTTEEPAGDAEDPKPEEPPAGEAKEGDDETLAEETAA